MLEVDRRRGFFFVDSSHALGPAGEASQIILEILPRLERGTYVHFHDIWFPYEYSPDVLSSALFFQHETALLYAFLCINERYRIATSLSLLHHLHRRELELCFPHMRPATFVDGIMPTGGTLSKDSLSERNLSPGLMREPCNFSL